MNAAIPNYKYMYIANVFYKNFNKAFYENSGHFTDILQHMRAGRDGEEVLVDLVPVRAGDAEPLRQGLAVEGEEILEPGFVGPQSDQL